MKGMAWVSLVVLIGSFLCRPLADPDLWWHIVVGRWIVAHREVPHVDYWNLFSVGEPWRAYSWSNEVLYALVERWYQDTGLAWLQVLLGCALSLAVLWVCGALAGDYFMGALVGVVAAAVCRSHFSLRPQTVVWIVFVLVIWLAEACKRYGPQKRYLAMLVCLGCIWANTHISAVFGILAVALWSFSGSVTRAEVWRIALLVGCFVAGTFISPYWGGEWLTVLAKSDHVFLFRSLDEFKPADLTQVPTLCVLFQVLVLAVMSYTASRLPPAGPMIVAALTIGAGALAVKFMPFACLAVGALTALWLNGIDWRKPEPFDRRIHGGLLEGLLLLRERFFSLQVQTIGALVFFIGCIGWVNIAKAIKHPVDYSTTPRRAVDFIETEGLQHPILNEFMSGGYLIYRWSSPQGVPQQLVPLDGRTNVNRPDVWENYMKAFRGSEQWRDYLRDVKPQTVIWRQGSPLVPLLLEAPEWCRVFESGKRAESFAVFITREEFDRRRGNLVASDCQ